MKKITSSIFVTLITVTSFAQNNTFPTNGNAGVGTVTPTEKFEVVGNTKVKGDLTVTNGDFKLKDFNDNSLTNDRLLGINPNGKAKTFSNIFLNTTNGVLDVNGNIFSSGSITGSSLNISGITAFTNKIQVYRITTLPGDTVIRFGDSTIFITPISNRISFNPGFTYKGISIGNGSTASKGLNSTSIGMSVRTDALSDNSICIGSGVVGNSNGSLINYTPNSLYIGFNSDKPTLFVAPGNGLGTTGKVAIGTINAVAKLNVTGLNSEIIFQAFAPTLDNASNFTFYGNGKTSIGIEESNMPGTYRLYVKDGILTEKVRVAIATTADWQDQVFSTNYSLMPFEDVVKYYKQNKHLPDVPDANTVVKNGIDLGEMDATLLKKIEESYLYMEEMKKEMDLMKNEIDLLKKENLELKINK